MLSDQGRTLDTLRRSDTFLVTNAAILGGITQSTAYQALDTAITQITAQAANQVAGKETSVGQTAQQVALRQTLRVNYMTPIATIAKEQAASVPVLTALRMPPSNATVAQLVARATAMAEAVTANISIFTGAGLPADIATQLQTAADAVSASVDTRAENRGRRTQATAGLANATKAGMSALRIISSIVIPMLTGSPLLAEWKSAIKVSAKLGAAVGTTVPPAVVTSGASATSPTAAAIGQSATDPSPAIAQVQAA